jgi:CheY-like chemotaxis protein
MTSDFKNQIDSALKSLEAMLGNQDKVGQIVSEIIAQTPDQFDQIGILLDEGKHAEAAAVIHKVKSRYGYIGLEKVFGELSQWEAALDSTESIINNDEVQAYFKKMNTEIINTLKETPYVVGFAPSNEEVLPLTGRTVLVAEDDEINSMVFELFIKELGAEVIVVRDGNEAVKLTIERKPDMIFMDVHMPFFSGIEAITQLRKKGVQCPIVSLSASTRLNEKEQSLSVGANEFLIKPANRNAIRQTLLRYIG